MARLEPQHVGDVILVCEVCGERLAVPVTCEAQERNRGRTVVLVCAPDLGPAQDHVNAHDAEAADALSQAAAP